MRVSWTLTAKFVATGITFLALALLSIGLTLLISWKMEGGAAAVNEAGRLRMQTYRLALSLDLPEPAEARRLAAGFDATLELLRTGDPGRPLFVAWSGHSRERFDDVHAQWAKVRELWLPGGRPEPRALALADADEFARSIDHFVGAIEDELALWTALLHMFQLTMLALAIGSAVVALYAGHLLVIAPVARLKRGVTALREGDLGARVVVDSRDEFGELSAGFNDMAQHLQSLYASLEDRVREKTARLEVKRQRLADLYEVSVLMARATQLNELAHEFARKVRRIAGADALAVRWSDEANDRYVLLASDNLPPEIAHNEACLDTASCHCGQARTDADTRVIPIQPASPAPLDHCGRAGFRQVVSVPIRLHDRVLGEMDLLFRAPVEISADDRELLDTLASHLAGAMEGLRVSALEREAAVAQERSLIARELHDSIAQSLIFLKMQTRMLRDSVSRGDLRAATPIVAELEVGVRESYADVRELLLHFRTRTSEESIEPALQTTLQKFEHQTGLASHLRIDARGVALPPDVQVQVLHIVQEALSNVRKHARATQVWLDVTGGPTWRFEVRDDGCGFKASSAAPDATHVGRRIMLERAQRIGAQVSVDSAPGRGCAVVLRVPVASHHDIVVPLPEAA